MKTYCSISNIALTNHRASNIILLYFSFTLNSATLAIDYRQVQITNIELLSTNKLTSMMMHGKVLETG